MSDQAHISSSMEIKGELLGEADIVIDGKVNGIISLKGHKLTIGPNGRVEAEIHDASSVKVLGRLIGNIIIDGSVEIAAAASMMGDIKAPRVSIEDGAQFRGNIDMARERSRSEVPAAAAAQSSPFGGKNL